MTTTKPVLWRQRLAGVVAATAGVAIVLQFLPEWPSKQRVVFSFESPQKVRSFSATWTRVEEEEPRGGARFNFNAGAPRQMSREISLPNGDYVFDTQIRWADEKTVSETTRRHRVTLQGRAVTLFLSNSQR